MATITWKPWATERYWDGASASSSLHETSFNCGQVNRQEYTIYCPQEVNMFLWCIGIVEYLVLHMVSALLEPNLYFFERHVLADHSLTAMHSPDIIIVQFP